MALPLVTRDKASPGKEQTLAKAGYRVLSGCPQLLVCVCSWQSFRCRKEEDKSLL